MHRVLTPITGRSLRFGCFRRLWLFVIAYDHANGAGFSSGQGPYRMAARARLRQSYREGDYGRELENLRSAGVLQPSFSITTDGMGDGNSDVEHFWIGSVNQLSQGKEVL